MTKFCVDCRHCRLDAISDLHQCALLAIDTNSWYVTGKGEQFTYGFCAVARIGTSQPGNCGRDAAWFEPKLEVA